jgi:hypothetical protein
MKSRAHRVLGRRAHAPMSLVFSLGVRILRGSRDPSTRPSPELRSWIGAPSSRPGLRLQASADRHSALAAAAPPVRRGDGPERPQRSVARLSAARIGHAGEARLLFPSRDHVCETTTSGQLHRTGRYPARGELTLRECSLLRQCDRNLVQVHSVFEDQLVERLIPESRLHRSMSHRLGVRPGAVHTGEVTGPEEVP